MLDFLGLLFSFPVYELFEKSVSKNKIRAAVTPPPLPEKIMNLLLTFILPNLTFNVYKSQIEARGYQTTA